MSINSAKSRPVLHIWPKTEFSLSLDPACIASLLYLQTYIPEQYEVEFCANPDLSPSGQLPYLTHGLHSVTGYQGIIRYASTNYHIDPTTSLDPVRKAQLSARLAHIESSLGELTSHVLYSLTANWTASTRPALVSILPVPQKYYLPDRIRLSHQPRLEAAELWNLAAIEQEEKAEKERFAFRRKAKKNKKAEEKAKFKETVERNKVLDKARAVLNIYSSLLGDSKFFYGVERPTTLDILLAAHIYLLEQDQPDNLIKDLLTTEYPRLVAHADIVYQGAFPLPSTFPAIVSPQSSFTLRSLLPSFAPNHSSGPKSVAVQEQERRFAIMRGLFFGGALLVAGAYISQQRDALVDLYNRIQLVAAMAAAYYGAEENEEDEDNEDDDEEEEEDVDEEAQGEGDEIHEPNE
ncbi:Tom37 C-terminal domain-containing protein [Irpex rosettiformis]|uniref:Tom37 C-terminal domain-containing protein n=1 Tax=Irpex rosettiformis TaxID=378272 RepID=A0ACB8TWI4_9APHY|nr:Tom37 C-terminal domain-containing protein [Irpex rosettiformis]